MLPPNPPTIRAALCLCLLVACSQPQPAPSPSRTAFVLDGKEPLIRVELRSLGDWAKLEVGGRGGLRVKERGGEPVTCGSYELRRAGKPVEITPLEGVLTVGGRTYSGDLSWDGSKLVNRLGLENYTLGVLRGELPVKHVPVAAAAAQAIAVRSYTLSYVVRGTDLDDTTNFQCYVGLRYAPDDAHLREGVHRTRGLYLDDGGRPLRAYYHSTCGGHTTDVPTGLDRDPSPAMEGVACPYCEGARYWRWSATLDPAPILKAAALEGPLESLEVVETGPGGRARTLRVAGGGQEKILRASAFRLAIGPSALRSTYVLGIAHEGKGYKIEGAGWGHGVGLCQCGAIALGDRGKSGEEIVAHYYPGAAVRRAY